MKKKWKERDRKERGSISVITGYRNNEVRSKGGRRRKKENQERHRRGTGEGEDKGRLREWNRKNNCRVIIEI